MSPETDFHHETEARKVMVDFKCSILVSLHRELPEVGLVEKLSGSLYQWWVELGVPSLHRSVTALSEYQRVR